MLAILLLAVVVPCAYSLGVIAPLYYDPGGGCSRWSPISSAISAHPGTAFYLVINPSDGPGPVGSQPDQSYDECIPSLRPSSNPNTVVLGFVKILASKSSSAILAEINTYAGWSSSSRPTGIYFDGTSASTGTQYKTYVSHAKDKGFNFIILDPGDTPNSDFYSLADIVNTYEDRYSDFRTADLIISASAPASKQSVILSEAPQSGSYSAKISQLASVGVAAVYVTDLSNDESGIPQQWSAFVNDVAAVGGVSCMF
ncbi:Spherulation-specific family 4 [Lyophyllum atratum]|nr:Spherulation-specific family 4 [Lyophyllum atratum]